MVRGPERRALRRVLVAVVEVVPDRRVRVVLDVDPLNML
jgi:hypothetical protein